MPTPFETLGIEPSFDVDLPSLEKRYRELSRVVHPDKFAGTGAQERRRALSMAVDVNAAFRVVKDPIRRAEALLAVHGVVTDERSQPKASPALLMDVMELREELSEARQARDLARVKSLANSVESRQARIFAKLSEGFLTAQQTERQIRH